MTTNNYSIYALENEVTQEVKDRLTGEPDMVYPEDMCHEVADAWVPIYYSDILAYAVNDTLLALDEPGDTAFDGTASPVNIIAANIYERLRNVAHATLSEWQEVTS